MKKFYAFLLAVGAFISLNGQATVTFQVDMTDYLANGGTIETIKIAGNFSALTGGAVPDWAPPSSPGFEELANNIFTADITFTEAGTLSFKFLNTADSWGDCNTVQECPDPSIGECVLDDGAGNINRTLVIPTENTTVCFKWESCESCLSSNTKDLSSASDIRIMPNPMSGDVTTISFNNTDHVAHRITLSNLSGQVMREFNDVRTNSVDFERGNLSAGMYFISISNEQGEIATKKLVIE